MSHDIPEGPPSPELLAKFETMLRDVSLTGTGTLTQRDISPEAMARCQSNEAKAERRRRRAVAAMGLEAYEADRKAKDRRRNRRRRLARMKSTVLP